MVKFINRCKVQVASGGTGTLTFAGGSVASFESLADQSVVDADQLRYTLEQGNEYEVGTGVIGLSGSTYTMTRTPLKSSNSDNSAINAGASAVCFFTMLADDIAQYLADLANVSDTSPSGGQTLTWDASASTWKPASPSGGIVNVSTYANLPASPSVTDLAFVTDTKALYIYDGAEWDRVYTGSQTTPSFTTDPPASLKLNTNGSNNVVTVAATDAEGFPISYEFDGFSGASSYTESSLPPQISSLSKNNGVFTFTPSTSEGDDGSFTGRFKASDGLQTTAKSTIFDLSFGLANCYGFSISQSAPTSGFHLHWYMILDAANANLWDDASFVSDCTFSTHQYGHGTHTKDNTDSANSQNGPGYLLAQQTALFGTTVADTTAFKVVAPTGSRTDIVSVTWTTARTISAIMISGMHTNGATYWQTGDVKAYIGGNSSSNLTSAYALSSSTLSGFPALNNKYIDFTA
jgi:hypothetical protein